jgi:capsular exopolysaccharide synthesis family protein
MTAELGSYGRETGSVAETYLRAVRLHWLVVAATVLVALGSAVIVVSKRAPDYQATAEILVTPLPQYEETFLNLDTIRDSGDPVRTMQTAAMVVRSSEAARRTAARLGSAATEERVLDAVEVDVKGESNILAVTATAKSAAGAARLANLFASAALGSRGDALHNELERIVVELRENRQALPPRDDPAAEALDQRINTLQSVLDTREDPTLSLANQAQIPTESVGPPNLLVFLVAGLAGLGLGGLLALALERISSRVPDEDEVLRLYPLPVLARVPRVRNEGQGDMGLTPYTLPPPAYEAFRSVVAQLEQRPLAHRRIVMVTSGSSGDGKTLATASIAVALAEAGYTVLAVDCDLRKPKLADTLGVDPGEGMTSLLGPLGDYDELPLERLMRPKDVPGLAVLSAVPSDAARLEVLLRSVVAILQQARERFDFVLLDTPPLGEVSDALRLTGTVDDVILVGRPTRTSRVSLARARDLLERAGTTPMGIVLNAVPIERSAYDAYASWYGLASDKTPPAVVDQRT